MAHLEKEGRKESVIREMQTELLEEAQQQPLLEEFRKADDSTITFERDGLVRPNKKRRSGAVPETRETYLYDTAAFCGAYR